MKAMQITAFRGPDSMQFVDLPDSVAKPGLEVIYVSAIGINYADTHQTKTHTVPTKTPVGARSRSGGYNIEWLAGFSTCTWRGIGPESAGTFWGDDRYS